MLDLIAFIFIVILSFVLCMNDNNYRCQLSHIVIGLSVIVFYKLAKYYNLNKYINENTTKEPFTADSMTNSINDFISNTSIGDSILTNEQAKNLSPTDLSSYNDKLTQLINVLNDIKNQQNTPPSNVAVSPESIQKLDLESQQQYQMFQIDYLNKQLQNMKNIINTSTVDQNTKNFKPIKIYSSCVVSNADGTTVSNVPLNQPQVSTGSRTPIQQSLELINKTASQSSTGSGPSLFYGTTENTNSDSSILGNILKTLSSKGAYVNITQ